jgi:hypothetical protein
VPQRRRVRLLLRIHTASIGEPSSAIPQGSQPRGCTLAGFLLVALRIE